MSLGNADLISLAQARERHTEARTLLANGIDPLEQRRQQKGNATTNTVTFATAVDAYLAAHEAAWRGPKHRQQWRNTLASACELIGTVPVAEIDTEHVLQVLQPIWHTTPEAAARLRGRIESVLAAAVARGWRSRELHNPATWRAHLQLLLPARTKVRPIEHHAALDWREAPTFMATLHDRGSFGTRALEFAILTAARSGEVRGATWAEIDFDLAVWKIPASRMKKGDRGHRVPLSAPALAILHEMAKLQDGSGLVFLGMVKGVPMSDMTLTAVLSRMGRGELTVHGFRSTFRDWAAETTTYPNHVVEQALSHAIGNKVEAAYRRGDLFAQRMSLMADWATFLTRPPATVVTLRRNEPAWGGRHQPPSNSEPPVAAFRRSAVSAALQ